MQPPLQENDPFPLFGKLLTNNACCSGDHKLPVICYCCICNSSSNSWFLIDYSSGWPISIVSQRQLTHIKADDHIAAAKTSVTETPSGVANDLVTVHSWWNDTPADMIEDYQVSQMHQRSPLSLIVLVFCKELSHVLHTSWCYLMYCEL